MPWIKMNTYGQVHCLEVCHGLRWHMSDTSLTGISRIKMTHMVRYILHIHNRNFSVGSSSYLSNVLCNILWYPLLYYKDDVDCDSWSVNFMLCYYLCSVGWCVCFINYLNSHYYTTYPQSSHSYLYCFLDGFLENKQIMSFNFWLITYILKLK